MADQSSPTELRARTDGIVTKLVRTHGSRWGRVRSLTGATDAFFNEASMSHAEQFDLLAEGDAVQYEEEADRVNGARAARLVAAGQAGTPTVSGGQAGE